MSELRSLDLDVEAEGRGGEARRIARIALVEPNGVTRDGSSPTITADCRTLASFEREVDRLRGELDDIVTRAATELGEARPTGAGRKGKGRGKAARPSASDAAAAKPTLEAEFSVQQVMTRDVRTVQPNDTIAEAKRQLDEGRVRHLVVLDPDGDTITGVLSHRDIFFSPLAWSTGQGEHAYEAALERLLVKEVMHGGVVSVDPSASLRDAARLLDDHKIGCLPVVDGETLVGILTEGDFVALFA